MTRSTKPVKPDPAMDARLQKAEGVLTAYRAWPGADPEPSAELDRMIAAKARAAHRQLKSKPMSNLRWLFASAASVSAIGLTWFFFQQSVSPEALPSALPQVAAPPIAAAPTGTGASASPTAMPSSPLESLRSAPVQSDSSVADSVVVVAPKQRRAEAKSETVTVSGARAQRADSGVAAKSEESAPALAQSAVPSAAPASAPPTAPQPQQSAPNAFADQAPANEIVETATSEQSSDELDEYSLDGIASATAPSDAKALEARPFGELLPESERAREEKVTGQSAGVSNTAPLSEPVPNLDLEERMQHVVEQDKELDKIRGLLREGKHREAKKLLKIWRKKNPKLSVPDDLKNLR